jgi:hypothetical protein
MWIEGLYLRETVSKFVVPPKKVCYFVKVPSEIHHKIDVLRLYSGICVKLIDQICSNVFVLNTRVHRK